MLPNSQVIQSSGLQISGGPELKRYKLQKNMHSDSTNTQKETILKHGAIKSSTLLDVGCGDGEITAFIAKHIRNAVGVDPDEHSIDYAKGAYRQPNLEFHVAPAECLDFPDSSFSSVLFSQSLHHVPIDKQEMALKESYRVLKTDGRLLIIEPIYNSGSFGPIMKFYANEEHKKQCAIEAIETSIGIDYNLVLKSKIDIEYHYNNLEDFYEVNSMLEADDSWSENTKSEFEIIFKRNRKSSSGKYILDYSAHVWVLNKR